MVLHGVILRGRHVFGEWCIKKWLAKHHNCPSCRIVLCQASGTTGDDCAPPEETHSNGLITNRDDLENLRYIFNIQQQERAFQKTGDSVMQARMRKRWRAVADARAELFTQGWLNVDIAHYGCFTTSWKHRLFYIPSKRREVNSSLLIPALEDKWDLLFISSSRPFPSNPYDTKEGDISLTAACHPLSASLRNVLVEALKELDGVTMDATALERYLNIAFTRSEIYGILDSLRGEKEYPWGFFMYQGQLNEAVVRRFLGLDERGGRRANRPDGWFNRSAGFPFL